MDTAVRAVSVLVRRQRETAPEANQHDGTKDRADRIGQGMKKRRKHRSFDFLM